MHGTSKKNNAVVVILQGGRYLDTVHVRQTRTSITNPIRACREEALDSGEVIERWLHT